MQNLERKNNLSAQIDLPVADKPDSQEICFLPNDDYKAFLQDFAPDTDALQVGEIIDANGKILGSHKGVANYTIGQHKGLGIAAPHPLYVTKFDVSKRQVVVGTGEKIFAKTLTATNAHWIYKPPLPATLQAKIRYGSNFSECKVLAKGNFLHVEFNKPQRAITAGQSIVFYDGNEVLGGAIIGGDSNDGACRKTGAIEK